MGAFGIRQRSDDRAARRGKRADCTRVGVLVGFTGVGGGALMTPLLVFPVRGRTPDGDRHRSALCRDHQGLRWLGTSIQGVFLSTGWCCGASRGAASRSPRLRSRCWALLSRGKEGWSAICCRASGDRAPALTSVAMLFSMPALHRLGQKLRDDFAGAVQDGATGPDRWPPARCSGFWSRSRPVGAGALGVVMLVYLYPYRLTPAKLVGTDIAHAVPLTLIAASATGRWARSTGI